MCTYVCVYVYVSMKCLTACVNSRVRGQPSEEGSREASFIQRGKDMVSKREGGGIKYSRRSHGSQK